MVLNMKEKKKTELAMVTVNLLTPLVLIMKVNGRIIKKTGKDL